MRYNNGSGYHYYRKRKTWKKTGKLLGLAPMFDHNMALIARGYPLKPKSDDLLISLFNDVLKAHPEYCKHLPDLTEDTVRKVIDKLGMKVRKQAVVELVMGRYELIQRNKKCQSVNYKNRQIRIFMKKRI